MTWLSAKKIPKNLASKNKILQQISECTKECRRQDKLTSINYISIHSNGNINDEI